MTMEYLLFVLAVVYPPLPLDMLTRPIRFVDGGLAVEFLDGDA